MARATRKREARPEPGSSSSAGGRTGLLIVAGLFVVVAIAGVMVIRNLVGLGQPVVNIDELERQEDVRMASLEKVRRSEELLRDSKLEEASKLLQEVVEADPNFSAGHLMLGYVLMQLGKLPLAAQVTRRAYELDPDEPAVCFQMGLMELRQGNVESAAALVRVAIGLRGQANLSPAPEYHLVLAAAFSRSNKPDKADEQMALALRIDRAQAISYAELVSPETQVALGRLLVKRGEMDEAGRLFSLAASQRPDRDDWYYLAARAYYVLGKYAQAASLIEMAVDLDPANGTYMRLKRQIEARGTDLSAGEPNAGTQEQGLGEHEPSLLSPFNR